MTTRTYPTDYRNVSQFTKDQLLRIALWELIMGGPGDQALWDRKIAQLLEAGAVFTEEP